MSKQNRKIYWRLKRDVQDGSVAWEVAWLVGYTAAGLVEITDHDYGLRGKVLSMDEIELKVANETAAV